MSGARHSTRRRPPRASVLGLTLIEVALAIGILAIMATVTWGSIARSFDAYEAVKEVDDRYHDVRVAMNRMAKEISMAFLVRGSGSDLVDDNERKTIFKGEDRSPAYRLDFTAFAHQVLRQDAKESDQCEISYFSEYDEENREQLNLMRREDPRLDRKPEEGGFAYVLAENIKSFELRFFDPKDDDWTREWDTEDEEFENRLPSSVELKLVVLDADGDELQFVTKTQIYLTRALAL